MAQNLLTPALNVFEHMALDETLARADLPASVLRFYHWTPSPAVTFGYAQFYDFVLRQTPGGAGPLCRRPTGGGMVFHATDLTFSLVFKSELTRPKEIYAVLHGAIERALGKCHAARASRQGAVAAEAYAPHDGGAAGECFVNPVENDLLENGKKILGGAIRRFGQTVLYQGSLQCLCARTDPAFRRAVAEGAGEALGVVFKTAAADETLLARARELAQNQYACADWNKKF